MKTIIFLVGFLLCFFLETTVIAIPLVMLWLLVSIVIIQEEWLFIVAFFIGLLLDSVSFSRLGMHSIFFLLFSFLIFLYEEKFEIHNMLFVVIFSFFGLFFYFLFFGSSHFLLQLIAGVSLNAVLFFIVSLLKTKPSKDIQVELR